MKSNDILLEMMEEIKKAEKQIQEYATVKVALSTATPPKTLWNWQLQSMTTSIL